jgi:hypothetical protein
MAGEPAAENNGIAYWNWPGIEAKLMDLGHNVGIRTIVVMAGFDELGQSVFADIGLEHFRFSFIFYYFFVLHSLQFYFFYRGIRPGLIYSPPDFG